MIRDYPDVLPPSTPTSSTPSTPPMSPPPTNTALPGTNNTSLSAPSSVHPRSGPILPPPKHPNAIPQTTYTPYIPRAKRTAQMMTNTSNPLSPTGQQIPLITSSAQGGITTRHPVPGAPPTSAGNASGFYDHGPSAALLDKVRALDTLPRLGNLRTLDLRANDLRVCTFSCYCFVYWYTEYQRLNPGRHNIHCTGLEKE